MSKKIARFEIKDILPIGLTIVVTGIGLAYGINILGEQRVDYIEADSNYGALACNTSIYTNCTRAAELNATLDTITGVGKLPEKLPLIVNVIVAAIIIGILIRYLIVRFG